MKKFFVLFAALLLFLLPANAAEEAVIYKSVSTDEKKIALSFDDGPHPEQTAEILDILAQFDLKATFFVVGENAVQYPDILRQISENGHEIGNHTYTHLEAERALPDKLFEDLEKNHQTILDICEYDVQLFRPPGGALNKTIKKTAADFNYKIVLWNIDTRDWAHRPADKIAENIMNNIKNGSIILFHDYIYRNSPTAEALKITIPMLKKEGYSFVTVGDLIECGQKATGK